jgi:hypothetical protein
MMDILTGVAIILLVGLTLVVAAVFAIILTKRDAGRRGRSSGALGNAMLEMHAILEPSKRHAARSLRAEEAADTETDDAGDEVDPDELRR